MWINDLKGRIRISKNIFLDPTPCLTVPLFVLQLTTQNYYLTAFI